MIITCPRCAAQYGVDPVGFGLRARTVHCSACDWQWEAGGPDDDAVEPGPMQPLPAAMGEAMPAIAADTPAAAPSMADTDEREAADVFADRPSPAPGADPVAAIAEPNAAVFAEPGPGSPLDARPEASPAAGPEAIADAAAEPEPHADAEPPPAAEDMVVAAADPPAAAVRRRRLVAGGAAAAAVVLVIATLVAAQGPISRAMPGAAAVYHLVGLAPAPPGVGLDIRDVASSREWTGTEDVLVVSGSIANVASAPRTLPPLRVSLFDDERTEVQTVVVEPARPVLAAGESVRFVARIVNPVSAARRMIVSFDVHAAASG